MAYDAEFIDGFDKYGPTGFSIATATIDQLLGEWTAQLGTASSFTLTIAAALISAGQSLKITPTTAVSSYYGIIKTYSANYARMIGGAYVAAGLAGAANGISFNDAGTPQLSIVINLAGQIEIRRGTITGTLLGTSTQTLSAGVAACLEWDVTIHGSAGIAKIWLNGVATSINLTAQNTRSTANNYLNQIQLTVGSTSNTAGYLQVDHLYNWLFIASGGAETPALTNPIVETQFPTSDSVVQFTPGAGVLGQAYSASANTNAPGANQLALRKFTPQVNCTLASVSIKPQATSAGAKFKGVVYSDSAGAPNALLSSGTEVVGATSGTLLSLALVTPQALTAGTPYWIGYITDTSVVISQADGGTTGAKAANTYASGAPGTAPGMTTGQASWMIYGNVTSPAANWAELDENPAVGDLSYVSSSTVSNQDLYGFPALASTPSVIYTVAVKAMMVRTDAGARTVDFRTKSSSTTTSGSNAGQTPSSAAYSFLSSYFDLDPNTSAAWGASGLNAATSGFKIAS